MAVGIICKHCAYKRKKHIQANLDKYLKLGLLQIMFKKLLFIQFSSPFLDEYDNERAENMWIRAKYIDWDNKQVIGILDSIPVYADCYKNKEVVTIEFKDICNIQTVDI